ncbi:uncharacterized protein PG998_010158 [Apiospora kogelbergensis]|uniref:uncharacterized protein n=1 Tax=Apiospora kogelbergensis TaxID=1337665 RepID=UPI00312D8AB7
MSSFSLANRTKTVPSSYLEGSLGSSHEPSVEPLYTSQEGLAFHTPPSATDACHFALSPEPIREEEGKVEPKHPSQPPPPQPPPTTHRQSSDSAMVVRRKSSANSSGDVAAPPPPQAKKKKYTRAFSHRARTGCMTW